MGMFPSSLKDKSVCFRNCSTNVLSNWLSNNFNIFTCPKHVGLCFKHVH